MKTITIVFSLFVINALAQNMGGWNQVQFDLEGQDETSQHVLKVLGFAVHSLSNLKLEDISNFQFVQLETVYEQVVAGTNWRLSMQFQNSKKFRYVDAIIFESLEGQLGFNSYSLVKDVSKSNSIAGGWKEIQAIDPDKLWFFISQVMTTVNDKTLQFVGIENLRTQVVAGVKYNFEITFQNKDGTKITYDVIAWEQLDGNFQILSCNIKEQETLNGGWTEVTADEKNLKSLKGIVDVAKNSFAGSSNLKGYMFSKVLKVRQQVVAGMKYEITYLYNNIGGRLKVTVLVWNKLDGTNQILNTSFNRESDE